MLPLYVFPDLFKQREDNKMPESSATKRVQCLDSVLLHAISPTKRAMVMSFNNSHIKLLSNNFNVAVLKNRIFEKFDQKFLPYFFSSLILFSAPVFGYGVDSYSGDLINPEDYGIYDYETDIKMASVEADEIETAERFARLLEIKLQIAKASKEKAQAELETLKARIEMKKLEIEAFQIEAKIREAETKTKEEEKIKADSENKPKPPETKPETTPEIQQPPEAKQQ